MTGTPFGDKMLEGHSSSYIFKSVEEAEALEQATLEKLSAIEPGVSLDPESVKKVNETVEALKDATKAATKFEIPSSLFAEIEENLETKKLLFRDVRAPLEILTKLKDISSEEYRIYQFEDYNYLVEEPVALYIRNSGAHVVVDSEGESHYIPGGWLTLVWSAKPGANHIDF